MKKDDYKQMEKEYRKGTNMLIIMSIIIVTGVLILNYYGV